jgi:hypothetical protein
VESSVGKGTAFTLKLPVARVPDHTPLKLPVTMTDVPQTPVTNE